MGIKFFCPNGHKLNVKEFQAGRKGICPHCRAKVQIPIESTRRSSNARAAGSRPQAAGPTELPKNSSDKWNGSPSSESISLQQPALAEGIHPAPADTHDPLAEAGDVVWYVRPASGGQFGPAGGDVMRAWIEEGRVSTDSLVWREGWRDWREASEVFAQFGADRAESPLTGIATGKTPPAAADRRRAKSRRRTKASQTVVIILLVLVVIVLGCVFVWVLLRQPAGDGNGPHSATAFHAANLLGNAHRMQGCSWAVPTLRKIVKRTPQACP